MRAATYDKYGRPEVVELENVPKPVPRDNEVLIKIRATTVSSADWRLRSLTVPTGFGLPVRLMLGISGPRNRILGTELAGEIEAVGNEVTRFKVGDAVFAYPGGLDRGCHAEFRTMPEDGVLALKPANLDFKEAAAICFGGVTALHFLRDGAQLREGGHVLIVGASGTVGSAAVQLAKFFGAEVTGVTSTSNLDLVRSLGADHVIDYTVTDFAKNGKAYDIVLDTTGTAPFSHAENR